MIAPQRKNELLQKCSGCPEVNFAPGCEFRKYVGDFYREQKYDKATEVTETSQLHHWRIRSN